MKLSNLNFKLILALLSVMASTASFASNNSSEATKCETEIYYKYETYNELVGDSGKARRMILPHLKNKLRKLNYQVGHKGILKYAWQSKERIDENTVLIKDEGFRTRSTPYKIVLAYTKAGNGLFTASQWEARLYKYNKETKQNDEFYIVPSVKLKNVEEAMTSLPSCVDAQRY